MNVLVSLILLPRNEMEWSGIDLKHQNGDRRVLEKIQNQSVCVTYCGANLKG
jgi:hypothetical protein